MYIKVIAIAIINIDTKPQLDSHRKKDDTFHCNTLIIITTTANTIHVHQCKDDQNKPSIIFNYSGYDRDYDPIRFGDHYN